MERTARDVRSLLIGAVDAIETVDTSYEEIEFDTMFLWDEKRSAVRFGVSYGKENERSMVFDQENNGVLVEV